MISSFSDTYAFLSNFYLVEVELDGVSYPSVEHAFQAAKTLDPAQRALIRGASTPGRAKRLGRSVQLRSDWEGVKLSVMEGLLRQKFTSGSDLAESLLGTGSEELVEGNTWGDTFWGVDTQRGGENHLGRLLMQIRRELWIPVSTPPVSAK